MKAKILAVAISIALSTAASAATFVAPTVTQSNTILNTTSPTLRTSLINIWLTSYTSIANTNKAYLDKVDALFGYVSAQYSTISNKMAPAAQVTYAWYF